MSDLKLVLASSSPRRKDLLAQTGLSFSIVKPDCEEVRRAGEKPAAYALRNAREKAQAVLSHAKEQLVVVSADTIVVLGDVVLEKPADTEDAKRMLRQLAGQEHVVITCVCVADQTKIKELRVETKVRFKELSDGEIARYVATGEPMDKAGSYAAQGLGAYFIKSISGSYTNVIGLPMAELCDALSEFGFRF